MQPEPLDVQKDMVAVVIGEKEPVECHGCTLQPPYACLRCPVFKELAGKGGKK